ncbi:YIP1 family protein [Bacillus sp. 179-C3.3 HS]|uniref:YIP1 family protein n=1 Tax=Bacillus sp. 179-C3.3 HS TaxID=3232162 RepID=UPI0039A3C2D4
MDESEWKDIGNFIPFIYLFGLIGSILGAAISAAIYKLVVFIAKGDASFLQLFSAILFITPITLIGTIISQLAIIIFDLPKDTMVTSLNALIDVPTQWHSVLASIDIFVIWGLVLTGFLFQYVGRMSTRASWIVVGIFYLFSLILQYLGATIVIWG